MKKIYLILAFIICLSFISINVLALDWEGYGNLYSYVSAQSHSNYQIYSGVAGRYAQCFRPEFNNTQLESIILWVSKTGTVNNYNTFTIEIEYSSGTTWTDNYLPNGTIVAVSITTLSGTDINATITPFMFNFSGVTLYTGYSYCWITRCLNVTGLSGSNYFQTQYNVGASGLSQYSGYTSYVGNSATYSSSTWTKSINRECYELMWNITGNPNYVIYGQDSSTDVYYMQTVENNTIILDNIQAGNVSAGNVYGFSTNAYVDVGSLNLTGLNSTTTVDVNATFPDMLNTNTTINGLININGTTGGTGGTGGTMEFPDLTNTVALGILFTMIIFCIILIYKNDIWELNLVIALVTATIAVLEYGILPINQPLIFALIIVICVFTMLRTVYKRK